jgi:hypothetical protein
VALTKVQPTIIAVANNVTNKTVGNTTSIPSFTFDGAGVVTSASNVAISGAGITANTVANSAFQTGSIENYSRATGLLSGMRNRIINGAMVIDQRNAGASVSVSGGAYTLDRWVYDPSASLSWFTFQQNGGAVTPPAGFSNYLGITSTGANTPTSGQFTLVSQYIEGFNTADLNWGTADAKTVTLSFWVRSSLTGTFGGALGNSAFNRSYPFTYTISAANTWEQKSITIAGDTTGTWVSATNGLGLRVIFGLGVGSSSLGPAGAWAGATYRSATGATNVSATNGATFYITGVQLEVGSTATSFDYRPYGTEFDLCRRYFERFSPSVNYQNYASGQAFSSTSALGNFYFYPKRAAVTVAYPVASNFLIYNNTATGITVTSINAGTLGTNAFEWSGSVASGLTAGNASGLLSNNTLNSYVNISAEL